MSETQVDAIRSASRQLVRELRMIGGQGCVPGMTVSECHVLTELDQRGRITVSDLAEILVLEKSTVSRLCRALEKRGLITTQPNPADRRQRPYVLTDPGKQQVQVVHEVAEEQVVGAFDFLADADRESVIEGIARYARALQYARRAADYRIRPLESGDDPAMARIITEVMTEFGAVGCGYSIEDPEVQRMFDSYQGERSAFFVVESAAGEVLGGGGVAPLDGGEEDTCELRKMYFLPKLRGTGMGTRLLMQCLDAARELGFARCYLETLESMHRARHLYRKLGFQDLDGPMGDTGHYKCNRWMAQDL